MHGRFVSGEYAVKNTRLKSMQLIPGAAISVAECELMASVKMCIGGFLSFISLNQQLTKPHVLGHLPYRGFTQLSSTLRQPETARMSTWGADG